MSFYTTMKDVDRGAIERAVRRLRGVGLIRDKSREEIQRGCREIELSQADIVVSDAPRGRAANQFTDLDRIKLMAVVNAAISEGKTTPAACEQAGVNYQTYMAWRRKYNMA